MAGLHACAGGVIRRRRRRGVALPREGRQTELHPERRPTPLPRAADVYTAALRGLLRTADTVTGVVQNGSLPVYLAVIVVSVLAVPAATWLFTWNPSISLPVWNQPSELVLAVIAAAGAVAATRVQRRMAAALMIGVVGYAVAGIYVVFSAPDLALTQLLIETLTVGLFALVLAKLPRRFGRGATVALNPAPGSRWLSSRELLLSWPHSQRPRSCLIAWLPTNTSRGLRIAGGKNVVNVVLTNFRALDTLGEITVLAAAGIGIGALVRPLRSRRKRGEAS